MKKQNERFNLLKFTQKKISAEVFGPNTLRSLPKGTKKMLEEHPCQVTLAKLPITKAGYSNWLDSQTTKLKTAISGMEWGVARKAMNIFMRDVFYNRFLFNAYCNDTMGDWLEIPVDRLVANALLMRFPDLSPWKTLKHLEPIAHTAYQNAALKLAICKGTTRVHLDLVLYLNNR